jgi:hypothetical protein
MQSRLKELSIVRAILFSTLILIVIYPSNSFAGLSYKESILYADVVVHGTIIGYRTERVPYDNYIPDTPDIGNGIRITILTIDVLDILKGHLESREIEAVIPGGYPGQARGMSGFKYNYEIGDEIVIPLIYWEFMKGGSYLLRSDKGRFIRNGDLWINQRNPDITVKLEDLIAIAAKGEVEEVAKGAEFIGCGTVLEINQQQIGRSLIETINIRLTDVWKGTEREGDQISFDVVRKGGAELSWYAPAPKFDLDGQWIVFLKKHDGNYYSFAGTNGLLRINGSEIIQAERVKLPFVKTHLQMMIKREVEK